MLSPRQKTGPICGLRLNHDMEMKIVTVLGPLAPEDMGVTDAHNHLWISPQTVPADNAPVLDQEDRILEELQEFKSAGGRSQIDCQPSGAGRDGNRLRVLSQKSGVHIVACTGFHLREYYPGKPNPWSMDADQAAEYFLSEIHDGLRETREGNQPVFPGFIKIAVRDTVEKSPLNLIDGAIFASVESGYAIEMHTEKGIGVVDFLEHISRRGLPLNNLVICHIDKRPDPGLHKELAQAGCLLEYDTFFRPKYHPEKNVWKLIPEMVRDGYDRSIALATDLADKVLWKTMGDGPGLVGFVGQVKERLESEISDPSIVSDLMGRNIAKRFALSIPETKS